MTLQAALTIAADGRDSAIPNAAGLLPIDHGVGEDVLWFKLNTPVVCPSSFRRIHQPGRPTAPEPTPNTCSPHAANPATGTQRDFAQASRL